MNVYNPQTDVYDLQAGLCAAVAEPNRIFIVYELSKRGALPIKEIIKLTGLSQSAATRHLRILREKHFVKAERKGQMVEYALTTPKVVQALDIFLEILNTHLAYRANLAKLERHYEG